LDSFSVSTDHLSTIIIKPYGYQFPEFPLDYWNNIKCFENKIFIGGKYISKPFVHELWFDYRSYQKIMANNLTMEKPQDVIIEVHDGLNDMYTWITIGMNVTIYFIIKHTHWNGLNISGVKKKLLNINLCAPHWNGLNISGVKKKLLNINLCAPHYYEKNQIPPPKYLHFYNLEFGYPAKYSKNDNVIFLVL
jgi:hypothetical protein